MLITSLITWVVMSLCYCLEHPELIVDAGLSLLNFVPSYLSYALPRVLSRLVARAAAPFETFLPNATRAESTTHHYTAPWWLVAVVPGLVLKVGLGGRFL